MMWGDASGAENYEGGRDDESMSIFAKEYVTKPVCNINHVEVCSPEEKSDFESVVSMSDTKLTETIQYISDSVSVEEKSFEKAVGKIQKQYEELTEEHSKKLESIKVDYKYTYFIQVLKSRGIKDPTADEDDNDDDDDDDDDDDAVNNKRVIDGKPYTCNPTSKRWDTDTVPDNVIPPITAVVPPATPTGQPSISSRDS